MNFDFSCLFFGGYPLKYWPEVSDVGVRRMLVITTKDEFSKNVLQAELPVLVDFWATWCGPCRMMMPVVEKVAELYSGKLLVAKVDIDQVSELTSEFGIVSVPTFMIFESGRSVARSSGGRSLEDMKRWIDSEVNFG